LIPVAAVLLGAISAGCGSSSTPPVGGLVVAAGGRLAITDAAGALAPFDGPAEPVVAVTASGGHVVAATAAGALVTRSGTASQPRVWAAVSAPAGMATGPPLIALSPLGTVLAVAVGALQGERFDLALVDLGTCTSRTIAVARGLNGGPSWIGPTTVTVDVIGPAGNAEIASIDAGGGGVTDETVTAVAISATADGQRVAVDDPSGDVLVGDAASWRRGLLESMTRLHPPAAAGVESLAISPDGGRLAIVRRDDAGTPSLELVNSVGLRWTRVRVLSLVGDGAISIGWLR